MNFFQKLTLSAFFSYYISFLIYTFYIKTTVVKSCGDYFFPFAKKINKTLVRHCEESSALLETPQIFTLTLQRINYSASICLTVWCGRSVHLLKTLRKLIMIIGQLLFTLLWQSGCVSTEKKHGSWADKGVIGRDQHILG